ncbi:non-hydrolyzing UDP-N-acetylglucosamine 2-epimerase [Enterococcus sp. AZ126]|uniref:non-hydrolyzing UDP-N-acetylglucosamine 2-epimerase n=1 Tax=Enterococcus sp. AZ126 TaxID=2774635 RepID=UPI003F684BEA
MRKIKVMTIFGTRPEAIKMAPIIIELNKQKEIFESIVVTTAQHRQMLDQVLAFFDIKADYDLNIMKENQTLTKITTDVINGLDLIFKKEKPDILLVHGDTTTTFAASISAFYNKVPIGHVEAGLRTFNKLSPFPEEINRQVTDVLADYYFAPTMDAAENLLKENHDAKNIYITGNTVVDALNYTVKEDYQHPILDKLTQTSKKILFTMHRRENLGQPMQDVFESVLEVVESNKNVEVIFPVHLNPKIQKLAKQVLGFHDRIHLVDPMDVIDFHNIASKCYFILSDSGGVQEEASALKVPVLVLRETTERPEGVKSGILKLIGTKKSNVKQAMEELLNDVEKHKKMCNVENPYGDGTASRQILTILQEKYTQTEIINEEAYEKLRLSY